MKRYYIFLFLTTLPICNVNAYGFESDGLYFNKTTASTVEVTSYSKALYSGEIVIPASVIYDGVSYSVTRIGASAFNNCVDLSSVSIPESITEISTMAFAGCTGLESVNITDLKAWCNIHFVTQDSNPLYYAHNLYIEGELATNLKIPDGVTSIKKYTFYNCSGLMSVTLPDGVISIEDYAFYGCKGLEKINIPQGVTSIGNFAFSNGPSIASITLPEGLLTVGKCAFGSLCSFSSINILSSVTSIGEQAFPYKVKTVNIQNLENYLKIKRSGDMFGGIAEYSIVLNGNVLKDLVIPTSVTTIAMNSFDGCTSVESITFHKDVTTIFQNAFNGCENVNKIICQGDTPPVCGADALTGISRSECTLYVPKSSGSNYQNTLPWSEFENIVGGNIETPDTPETCEVPVITFDNTTKQLKFESATTGAKYNYTVSSEDMADGGTSNSGIVQMAGVYDITAYAYADDMYNSEKATAKLLWVNAVIDSSTEVISAKTQRGVIVSTQNGNINISGTATGETISVYNAAGSLVRKVKAGGENTVISGLEYDVYIVKIGGTSVKIALAEL